MNRAASATRRSPADTTTSAGCCPMFSAPFFGLPAPTAAPQCFLSSQAQQLVQLARNPQQQPNVVLTPQQQTVSQQQQQAAVVQQHQHHQHQTQPHQLTSHRSHDHTSNNYSTSVTAPGLSLQQLIANRHPASSCMALAAALASANFPHFQHSLAPNHQTPINQPSQTVASTPLTQPNATTTHTNQVPILNYNNYTSQPSINLPTLTVPQPAQPVAAHSNTSDAQQQPQPQQQLLQQQQQQQQQHHANNIPNLAPTNLNLITQTALSSNANQLTQNGHQLRTLVSNNMINSSATQPQNSIYRGAQPQPLDQAANVHQQQPSTPLPTQQLGQVNRNILSDETINTIFNEQFQAILLNQLFSSHQFAPPVTVPQLSPQPINAPAHQQPENSNSRIQATLPLAGQTPVVITPAQVASVQVPPAQQQSSEQASENNQQQAFQNASTTLPRLSPFPTIASLIPSNNAANSLYQMQPINSSQAHQAPPEPVVQAHQPQQTIPQIPSQSHQSQPQASISIPPLYTFHQMEQALTLLTNPQVANNIFSHVFNIYFQSGLRSDPHQNHHHNHPPHFHPHLHGAHHHHHHHGQNGQSNGQDATLPLDSLAISESKPRGLNRTEIDSLTPYIHTNEKDARTCVICLSKFEFKSKIRPLPCNHAFHAKCVDKWLRANRTCPICRRDALKSFNGKIKRI